MYDENAQDECTITVIATGLDEHGSAGTMPRPAGTFAQSQTPARPKPAAPQPVQSYKPESAYVPGAAQTAEKKENVKPFPQPSQQPFTPTQTQTQISIPSFLKNKR